MHTVIVEPYVMPMDFLHPLEVRGNQRKSRDRPPLTPLNNAQLGEAGEALPQMQQRVGTGQGHLKVHSPDHAITGLNRNLWHLAKFLVPRHYEVPLRFEHGRIERNKPGFHWCCAKEHLYPSPLEYRLDT